MELTHNTASPFIRKVMVCLHETGQLDKVTLVPSAGHPTATGSLPVAQNPLGKVPALIRTDGPTLYDSRVICRFIDDLGNGGLYPSAPRLWETLTLEATGDGILDAAVLMVYEHRARTPGTQDETWVEGQWAKIDRTLTALEARWMPHLQGPLDIGVITVGCALGYLDFRHGDRDWRATRPALAAWEAAFVQRDSMAATVPSA